MDPTSDPIDLHVLTESTLGDWLKTQSDPVTSWIRAQGFAAERHRILLLPGFGEPRVGAIAAAVLGMGNAQLGELDPWWFASLPERLPAGKYRLRTELPGDSATALLLGWQLGCYRLARWRSAPTLIRTELLAPENADQRYATACSQAMSLARDLINAPPNEMGPVELGEAASALAHRHGANVQVIAGRDLIAAGYPLVHAVGAGSAREPRLIDIRWGPDKLSGIDLRQGDSHAPRVTLVGKGVCFDSGGLNLKDAAGMLLMKKDLGGAACALATASMIMTLQLPVQLRVLIPAVENSVDGLSYRPSDVLPSRKGLKVEIGNTDAEGRLVLADALTAADEDKPSLLVDFATLTGAARVALGPELPAAFSNDRELLGQLQRCGELTRDPLWPMPLWAGYDDDLSSRVADLNNVASHPFAGAIIGALFLQRFVTATPHWLHLDLYGWNPKDRPGRPIGGEAQCVRAVYELIRQRFG